MYRTLALAAFIALAGTTFSQASHDDSPPRIDSTEAENATAQECNKSEAALVPSRKAWAIEGLTLAEIAAKAKWRRETFTRLVSWSN